MQTKTQRIDEVQWKYEIQLDSSDTRKRKNDRQRQRNQRTDEEKQRTTEKANKD